LKAAVKQAGVDVIMVKEMNENDSRELSQTSSIEKSLMREKDVIAKLLDNLTDPTYTEPYSLGASVSHTPNRNASGKTGANTRQILIDCSVCIQGNTN
jgi:hypothetical protein